MKYRRYICNNKDCKHEFPVGKNTVEMKVKDKISIHCPRCNKTEVYDSGYKW